eukprot:942065_1
MVSIASPHLNDRCHIWDVLIDDNCHPAVLTRETTFHNTKTSSIFVYRQCALIKVEQQTKFIITMTPLFSFPAIRIVCSLLPITPTCTSTPTIQLFYVIVLI